MTKKESERLEKSRGNAEQMGNLARQMRIDASTIRKYTVQNQKNVTGRTPQVALTRIGLVPPTTKGVTPPACAAVHP
jgi:hypothetical protein